MNEAKIKSGDFQTLKQIGIEQIKKDTKLDSLRISDILEKRFEKFDYVRAKGFINILEKEYNLDLSNWLEEYRLFNPLEEDENQEKEAQEEYCKKIRQKRFVFLGLGAVCVLVILIALTLFLGSDEEKEERVVPTVQSEVIPQVPQEQSQQNQVSPNLEAQEAKIEEKPQESTPQPQEEKSIQEVPKQTKVEINKPIYELGNALFDEVEILPESTLYLSFEKPIWVGTVELKSKRRTAQTQQEYEIFLDKDMLIYIAYGSLLASVDGNEKKIRGYEPLYLIYTQEGGLRKLTQDEYLFANGGIKW